MSQEEEILNNTNTKMELSWQFPAYFQCSVTFNMSSTVGSTGSKKSIRTLTKKE